ncbi:hypothetical protein [Streptomyces sp. NPDC017520]|uniref:hypothetical protein n=1 Tax=Streptomyces sp. NPDC017520 TaxID=3364998 RepID=UPI0037B2CF9A
MSNDEDTQRLSKAIEDILTLTEDLSAARNRIRSLENDNAHERITALEDPPPAPRDVSKILIDESAGKEWADEHAAIADQQLYWSTQAIKFDPSILTVAPDLLEITPTGIEILGVNITPGWKNAVEGFISGLLPWDAGGNGSPAPGNSPDGGRSAENELGNLRERQQEIDDRTTANTRQLRRHESAIKDLARGQRHTSAAARTDVSARAGRAERSARFSPVRRQAHAAEARELRQAERDLQAVQRRAAELENTLG